MNCQKRRAYNRNPGADVSIQQMRLNRPTTPSKGLRCGSFVQIPAIIEAEMENVFAGAKDAQAAGTNLRPLLVITEPDPAFSACSRAASSRRRSPPALDDLRLRRPRGDNLAPAARHVAARAVERDPVAFA